MSASCRCVNIVYCIDIVLQVYSSNDGGLIRRFGPRSATQSYGHADEIWVMALHSTNDALLATGSKDK